MKIAFFGVDSKDQEGFFRQNLSGHDLYFFQECLTSVSLPEKKDFDIISIFVHCKADRGIIDSLPNVKLITTRSTGFDHIDISYAKSKNILVSNVPSYGSHTVAEFTFGLILSLTRKIYQSSQRIKESLNMDYKDLLGLDLNDKTLGVLGTGKIGANVIKIAQGFNMKVLAFDILENKQLEETLNFKYLPLDQVLKNSDLVTIHTPATPQTHHLINNENIRQIKEGALLINTSRGAVIDTEALFDALVSNHLAGAALDVLEEENELSELNPSSKPRLLINLPQVLYTPHMAHYSKEAEENILKTTLENIQVFLANKPQNLVN